MVLPLIPMALGLSQFVPAIARWLGGEQAESVASRVVDTAKQVAGVDDPLDAMHLLGENATLVANFQREIIKMEAEFELQVLQDRQNARERDIAFAQVGRKNLRADIRDRCIKKFNI